MYDWNQAIKSYGSTKFISADDAGDTLYSTHPCIHIQWIWVFDTKCCTGDLKYTRNHNTSKQMALMQLRKKLSHKKRCILKFVSTSYSTKPMHDFKEGAQNLSNWHKKNCTLEKIGNILVPEVNRTQASQETVSKPWVWASRRSIASHTRVRWQQRDTATQPRLPEMETHSSYTYSRIPFSSS